MKYAPEIQEKFNRYAEILRDWQTRMNLVAPSTLDDIQHRHIDDSAQLAEYIPGSAKIIDMGSGAGFPALVLAILGWDVVAIESISKKVRFLEEVKSQLNLTNFNVVNDRVENVITGRQVEQVDQVERLNTCPICSTCLPVYTARAFAPLVKILDYVGAVGGRPVLYLLKGANVMEEIRMAQEKYKFEYELYPSKTGDGFVVKIVF